MTTPAHPTAPTPVTASSRPFKGKMVVIPILIIAAWVAVAGLRRAVLHFHQSPRSFSSTVQLVPPMDLCPGTIQLDATAENDRSADVKPYEVFLPGSTTKVCFGSWASIPPNWGVWGAEFTNPDPVKDGCVAWLHYQGINRIYGPFTGTQNIALSNMPGKWRIASNCPVMYYKN